MIPPFIATYGYVLLLAGMLAFLLTRLFLWLAASRPLTLLLQARRPNDPPRVGGVAVYLGFATAPLIAALVSADARFLLLTRVWDFVGFLAAGGVMLALGVLDDLFVLDYRQKYIGQAIAGVAVYVAGYRIDELGLPWGGGISLGLLAPIVTVAWIVFFANAMNLIDGKDGVATGVAILAALAIGHVASRTSHPTVALLLVALAGGNLGFLPWNLPRASAYLGDSGALFLGFVLSALSIRAVTGEQGAVFLAVPIVALGFPLLDTVLAPMRRFLDHRHPFLRDEDHIHHRLVHEGFGPRGVLVVVYSVSALFAVASVTLHHVQSIWGELAISLFVVVVVLLILARLRYLGSLWNSRRIVSWRRRLRPEH